MYCQQPQQCEQNQGGMKLDEVLRYAVLTPPAQGWREKILEGSVGGHVWGPLGHPWQSDFIYRFFKLKSGLFGFVF